MSLFSIFRKQENQSQPLTAVRVGDWVTQYSAGYWKVVNIFPKYADEDHNSDGKSWKKGDRLGDWVILKKGFTPKMKPSNACEFVDAQWCKPVANDIKQSIEATFAENPKAKAKFENAPNMPKPSVASAWMALTDEQAESFSECVKNLPDRFTAEQFWTWSASYRQYLVDPSKATHVLYLFSYLWEIDEQFEPLHFSPELKKIVTNYSTNSNLSNRSCNKNPPYDCGHREDWLFYDLIYNSSWICRPKWSEGYLPSTVSVMIT